VYWLPRYTGGLALAACFALGACGGGDDDGGSSEPAGDTQTITFQQPEDPGRDPFTPPADVRGGEEVEVSQPFGGSGSNRVCDRDKLIEFLEANPERMAEWARVLDVDPDIRAVKKYIAKLHPVTLTRDTQVTNHAFTDGRAVPFQAILQAGTAVLVDKYGVPVVRCFCGNPLGPAVFTPEAKCTGCPPNYKPPRQCEFGRRENYDESYYRRDHYGNGDYDEVFIRRHRSSGYADCYEPYPDPPVVTAVNVYRPPPTPEPPPPPPPEPEGLQCDPPRSQLEFEQCRELEHPEPDPPPQPEPDIQCEPPRSQLEAERCADLLRPNESEPEPGPDPNYDCPDQPPAHPGEDYLRNCG
jgi:hypothetical protein